VLGELYIVDQMTLGRLDRLEGNGDLYDRGDVEVLAHPSHTYMAQAYVYNGKISSDKLVTMKDQPWGKKKDANLVWYACYGSNLGSLDRIPVLSFTSPDILEPNPPSDKYLSVIRRGLMETWPELGKEKCDVYLRSRV